ncbi:hypothetical protein L9F63_013891 [Diploptera punctata]|uniref:Chitin-binding type-2 domain-containing protein n=1 Tax=Diploptera punctata TaxID=6984 RepID=A0AAD8A9Z1_DIPPU|nr:hypothetical protein L9F63_013891 [Diploptera punctata]
MKVLKSIGILILLVNLDLGYGDTADECPAGPVPGGCPVPDLEFSTFFPHPNDCHWFFHCSNGVPYCKECAANLHWNQDLETCDYPGNVNCDAVPAPTTVRPTRPPATSPPTTVRPTRPPATSPPTTVRPTRPPATSPPTTVRPTRPPATSPPTTVRPTRPPATSPPTTVRPTRPPTTRPPTTVRPTRPPTTRPPTTVRPTRPPATSPPTTVRPTRPPATSPPTTVRPTRPPATSPPTTVRPTRPPITTTSDPTVCPPGNVPTCPFPDPAYSVFFPHENDCQWFYHCSNGVAYCKICPAGLHWNTGLNTCDYPYRAGCDATL